MMEHYDEVRGDQIAMHENIRGIHGAMASKMQDCKKVGMLQKYAVITVR